MKIYIKNVEYFEWEVPDELIDLNLDTQDMIDRYFTDDDISVAKISDDYYEENV